MGVFSVLPQKFFVSSYFSDAPLVEDNNAISQADGAEAVRDD